MTTKKVITKKAVKKVAKKVTKKKMPKKAVIKKTTKAKKTKKDLVHADGATAFWVRNGMVLDSLVTLSEALAEMEKEVYLYHVRKDRNDFAEWVETVLVDPDCAKDLKKAKTPQTANTVVIRHLKLYSV